LSGDYAYVTGPRFWVISISDPSNPAVVSSRYATGQASSAAVSGYYAYAVSLSSATQLLVIRVADPGHPVDVGGCGTLGSARGVAVSGSHAYVVTSGKGLRVVTVADPAHPAEVGHYNIGSAANSVALVGGYAYVAHGERGLQIFQYYGVGVEETQNADVRSINQMPNIGRGVLRMGDRGQKTGDRADLLDASGRRVMDLEAGANDVSALAPGVYFVHEARTRAIAKVIITR
jgi:hypothetical protein